MDMKFLLVVREKWCACFEKSAKENQAKMRTEPCTRNSEEKSDSSRRHSEVGYEAVRTDTESKRKWKGRGQCQQPHKDVPSAAVRSPGESWEMLGLNQHP